MRPTFGLLSVSVALVGMLVVVSCNPVQCDDSDANEEAKYGQLQAIPPAVNNGDGTDPAALADEPVKLAPSKTQHDILKSRNSKFLGVDTSSEEQ